ncbi:hypothetical protein [Nostoc sp.]|uniref:hypothetical protein n=1 Tax=Nostoc sp. TaxID=1180 RepID=UPI002FF88EA4
MTSVVTYITCKFEYRGSPLGLIHRVYQTIAFGASLCDRIIKNNQDINVKQNDALHASQNCAKYRFK